jgi:ComF family protein
MNGFSAPKLWRDIPDLLFPRQCEGCGGDLGGSGNALFCWDCLASLPYLRPPFCARCGDFVAGDVPGDFVCASCARHPPAFDLARSAFRFDGAVAQAVKRLKYRDGIWIAPGLGAFLAETWRALPQTLRPAVDWVTPVPLASARARERGYNQAGLLAKALARRLRLPCREVLRRTRDTGTQTKLTAQERRKNVRGAFAVKAAYRGAPGSWRARWFPPVEGARILLVDDVITTGATVDECARALKAAGAAAVYALSAARGNG